MAGLGGGDGQTKLAERGFVPSYLSGDALIGPRLVLGAAESPLRAGCLACAHTTIPRHQALETGLYYSCAACKTLLDISHLMESIFSFYGASLNEGGVTRAFIDSPHLHRVDSV
jgi:hypothetical protein